MPSTYRIAAHLSEKDLTRVDAASHFGRCIGDLFSRIRPRKVVETGTYRGTGTTTIIARALRDLGLDDARFISIEVNPGNVERATQNLANAGLDVDVRTGLSVPRGLLPTIAEIERAYVANVRSEGLIVDHEEADRARLYFGETNFPHLPDDLLGAALAEFDDRPDFVLLDSGGHVGFVEFNYLIGRLAGPCHLALDDIYHVKHFQSFERIKSDPRFELVTASEEKFGFCIARFTPGIGAGE